MVAAEGFHQLVLKRVDILEFIEHDVFEELLPLEADFLIFLKDVEREFDEVVVVQSEAFLFLVQVAVENDVLDGRRGMVLFIEDLKRHGNHVLVVFRFPDALLHFDHVARFVEGHVAQGEAHFLINDGEHLIDVGVVDDEEILRIGNGKAVFLQDGDAEAVECIDVSCVVVAGQAVNAHGHFACGFIRECDAEYVAWHDAEVVHKVGETAGKGACLARACACDDAHVAFCRGDGFDLFLIESFQYVHISLRTDILISLYNRRKYLSAQCDGGDACHGNDDAQDLPRGDLFSVKEGPHDHEGEDDEAVRHDEGGIDGPACLVHVDVPKLDADDGSAKTEGRRIDGEDVLLPSCFPCPLDEVNGKGNGGCDEVGHDERDEGIHTGRDFLQPDLVSDT